MWSNFNPTPASVCQLLPPLEDFHHGKMFPQTDGRIYTFLKHSKQSLLRQLLQVSSLGPYVPPKQQKISSAALPSDKSEHIRQLWLESDSYQPRNNECTVNETKKTKKKQVKFSLEFNK